MKCQLISLLCLFLLESSRADYYRSTEHLTRVFACRNEQESMMEMTMGCRAQFGVEDLPQSRKTMDMISGPFLATVLKKYCKVAQQVDECVLSDLDFASCSENVEENFESAMLKTNWMCRREVQDDLVDRFSSLPWVSIKSDDRCYQESVKRTYQCIRRFMTSQATRDRPEVILRRAIASVPCAFRKLRRVCPREKALVLTIVNYDWLFLPPAFGVNLTQTLMNIMP